MKIRYPKTAPYSRTRLSPVRGLRFPAVCAVGIAAVLGTAPPTDALPTTPVALIGPTAPTSIAPAAPTTQIASIGPAAPTTPLPAGSAPRDDAIARFTAGMVSQEGFLPVHLDPATGKVFLEISRFEEDI